MRGLLAALLVLVPAVALAVGEGIGEWVPPSAGGGGGHGNGANCSAGNYPLGVDANGAVEGCTPAGSGDAVSIDGTGATDPDFRSDGSVNFIRCTGAGAPDARCVGAEDVIADPTELRQAATEAGLFYTNHNYYIDVDDSKTYSQGDATVGVCEGTNCSRRRAYYPEDYNLGSSTTDGIQEAWNAASSDSGGGAVVLANANYVVDDDVSVDLNVAAAGVFPVIVGSGPESRIISNDATPTVPVVKIGTNVIAQRFGVWSKGAAGASTFGVVHIPGEVVWLRDIWVEGFNATDPSPCYHIEDTNTVWITGGRVRFCSAGAYLDGDNNEINMVGLTDIMFTDLVDGIVLKNRVAAGQAARSVWVTRGLFQSFTGQAISILEDSVNCRVRILDSHIENVTNNTDDGIVTAGCGVTSKGNEISQLNANRALYVTGGAAQHYSIDDVLYEGTEWAGSGGGALTIIRNDDRGDAITDGHTGSTVVGDTLTDGSNADALHAHDIDSVAGLNDIDTAFTFDGVTVDFDGGTAEATLRLPNSATLPATCEIGDTYWDTDGDTDGSLYVCRATNIWKEVDDDGGAGGGNGFATIGSATADVGADSMTAGANDGIGVSTDTTNDPEDISVTFDYTQTQAGNPALAAEACIFSNDGTGGGGILCEGTTADTNEGLIQWNPTTDKILTLPDATDTLVGRATTDTLTNKTINGATIDATSTVGGTTASNIPDMTAPETISGQRTWTATGTFDFAGPVAATSFTADPSATPEVVFDDSDSASEATDARIQANATDVGAGTEDVDVTISTQVNSVLTPRVTIDADGFTDIPSLRIGGLDCSAGDQYITTNASGDVACGTDNSGGGATITVEEDDSTVDAATTNLDFGLGFDVTSSPAGEANVVLDYTEDNPILATETTGDFVQNITAGDGLASTGATSGENIAHTLSTASQEANFLADGGVTSLTCGASNPGKSQVMDDGDLEWCDGAATPALQSVDSKIATHTANASAHHVKTTSADDLTGGTIAATVNLAANVIDATGELDGAICGTNEILEDQGASWACIATPAGGAEVNNLEATDPPNVLDDEVYVGTGAAAGNWIVLPDSDGATQKLQYDQTTGAFSAGTDDDIPESGDFTNLTGGNGIDRTGGTLFTNSTEANFLDASTTAPANDGALVVDTDGDGTNVLNDVLTFQSGTEDFIVPGVREYPTVSNECLVFNPVNDDWEWSGTDCTAAGGGGDSVEVEDGDDAGTFTAIDTTARFEDQGDINFAVTDGGPGGPDAITATVRANSVALGTDTTGNYAAGDAEAGAALTGDSATGFFTAGQLEAARGGTGIDSSASTGVARVSAGTWTADATLAHLGASSGQIDDDDLAAGAVDGGPSGEIADGSITADDLASNIQLLTTGTIRGMVDVVATSGTTLSPTADQMRGSFHTFSNTAVVTITLPAAVTGMSACFYDLDGTALLTIDVDAADVINLNGTALAAGNTVDSAGARGDFICVLAVDATNWLTLGRSGTWVDGGAT